jgi:hypothetical protein
MCVRAPRRVEAMFKSLDFESKGEIEYLEFVAATMSSQKNLAGSNSILAAFNVLDVDHDGVITKAAIAKAFSGQIDDKVADALMKHRNESGEQHATSTPTAVVSVARPCRTVACSTGAHARCCASCAVTASHATHARRCSQLQIV